ncbi:MAG: helicase, partial [Actinomycetota bacterium]|nr:helicase [Actinomycetota bacterium]
MVLATIPELAPLKPHRTADEPHEVARLKGDARMAGFLAAAVRLRQRPLREAVEIPHGAYVLRLTPEATKAIVRRVRGRGGDHNHRRPHV